MTIEADYLDLMPATVTWQPFTSVDGYGKPAYGAASSIRCRVEPATNREWATERESVRQTTKLYLYGVYGVGAKDKITMPDGTVLLVQSVSVQWDETGPHHEEVMCA